MTTAGAGVTAADCALLLSDWSALCTRHRFGLDLPLSQCGFDVPAMTALSDEPGIRQPLAAIAPWANMDAISSAKASNCLCLRAKNIRLFYSLRGKDTISQFCVRKVRACRIATAMCVTAYGHYRHG